MHKSLIEAQNALGRFRESRRYRPGHQPGQIDVRNESDAGFEVRPNFYYFEALGAGRPAWLPIYPTPQMVAGAALNYFSSPDAEGWPMELGLDLPIHARSDWIRVVGQFDAARDEGSGFVLQNEHVVGSWFDGGFEASGVWNLVLLPVGRCNYRRLGHHRSTLIALRDRHDFYLAWASDLWLGNTGLRQHLWAPRDAAQNLPAWLPARAGWE